MCSAQHTCRRCDKTLIKRKKKAQKMKKSKKLLLLLGLGALAYTVLKVLLLFSQTYFVIIYELLAGVPFIVYVCIVRGRIGTPPSEDMLPSAWSQEEKQLYLSQLNEQRKKGKICMNIAFPFIMALLMAAITEIYLPMLMK